jgi:hypothetical protein
MMLTHGMEILTPYAVSISKKIRRGSMANDNTVETKLMVIERATLPLDQYVKMFDVVPPGEDPTNIRPTAYSSDRLNMRANAKEIIGMKKYWLAQPIAIAWGFPMAVRTASFVVEAPSPSPMMTRNAAETNVAASTIVQTANRTPDHNNQTNQP